MGRAAARVVFPVENAVSGLGRALEVATSLTPAGWPGPRTLGFRFRDSSLQIRREPFVRLQPVPGAASSTLLSSRRRAGQSIGHRPSGAFSARALICTPNPERRSTC
jgi:hypothetical protein